MNSNKILGMATILIVATILPTMVADGFTISPIVQVSRPSPFTPGCNGATQSGTNYINATVEPWVAINPANLLNIIGVWQQDRWSNGGSNGLLTGVSFDGGTTWTINNAHFSRCAGGNPQNGGDYERSSDPWVTINSNGIAYQISISFNDSNTINGILVSKSPDNGTTWGEPVTLIRDTNPLFFNDKESITADPTDPNKVYAVWDRLQFPSPLASASAAEHSSAFKGPAFLSRTTDNGNSWETPRAIFDPGQEAQTIGNQIVVLPNGNLIDIFDLFSVKNAKQKLRGASVAIIRSTDKGSNWSNPIIIAKPVIVGVNDPNNGQPIRTSDIIPEISVDNNNGNLYTVWQDGHFTGNSSIAFSMSTDGGSTWSGPIKIDKTPNNFPAFTPSIHVSSDGTIGVTYYDFRNNGVVPGLPTDYWMVHCSSGCVDPLNWSENHIKGPFNLEIAPVARGLFVGDYEGLTNMGNAFVPFFVTTTGDINDRTDVFTANVLP